MSKVIKAVFTGRFCKTQRVFQFDTDDKLQIVNVDLPASFTVDFSNSKTGDSVSVLATSDTVQIPPDLFVPGSEIYAWIWLSDSNGGHTRCEATIPIDPRARRTGTEPTPAQASAWDEAVDTLNETVEGIPAVVDAALTEAKESGEFDGEDGADGSNAWMIDVAYTNTVGTTIRAQTDHLIGPPTARPMYGDVLFVSDGRFGNITSPGTRVILVSTLGDLHGDPGEDGYSPAVTITEITGGHRVTITDEAHPQGQSFDVMDGTGGSGTGDYDDLSNKPQIAGVTLSGNKSLADLGIAAASDIPTVPSAYTSTPADLGTASAGSSTSWAKGDHVHKMPSAADVGAYALPSGGIPKTDLATAVQTSLGKADTALQSAPVTSVNGQTGAVSLSIPTTASDVGAVAANQGVASANMVLTVNGSGIVAPEDTLFEVTFTPTSPDYSGTIDWSPADLAAAYEAGKRIIAYAPAFNFRCELSLATIRSGGLYTFDFIALGELNGQDIMLRLLTSDSTSTFTTKIYPLATGQWTGGSY